VEDQASEIIRLHAELDDALKELANMKVCVYVWICVCMNTCMHVCNAELDAALKQVANIKVCVYVWVCVCMNICRPELDAALKQVANMKVCVYGFVYVGIYSCMYVMLKCMLLSSKLLI
jgi:hypothetical protein